MMKPVIGGILLDPYAVLRISADDEITPDAKRDIDDAAKQRRVFISPISAWEIGTLVRKGRIVLSADPLTWFERALAIPGLCLAPMLPPVLIASAFLSGDPPADPADRIIVTTARTENLILMTRDREILSYAALGHVQASRC